MHHLLVSHNLRAVEKADLILYIEGGQILEQGTHEELLQLGGRYAAMYALQSAIGGSFCEDDAYAVEA